MKDCEWISNDEYSEIIKKIPICCVDIVLLNETKTKILLGKRNNEPLKGEYFSIGGRLQKNEQLKDCAVRKAREELGLKISSRFLTEGGVINEIYPNSPFGEDGGYHAITVYFGYIVPPESKIILDSQHSDFKWVEIDDPTLHPYVKERINKIFAKI